MASSGSKLYDDLILYKKECLKKLGIYVDNMKFGDIPIYYNEYKIRTLAKVKHDVFLSQELKTNKSYIQYAEIIQTIKKKLCEGKDVTQYLSKGIKNIQVPDAMLNDWGIIHFHLSNIIEKNGFVKRTGDLLFAYRNIHEPTKLYFLNIYGHGDWTEVQMMKILHKNWDNVLDENSICTMTDMRPNFNNLSNRDRKKFRDIGANMSLEIDNNAYLMIGGGFTCAGTNFYSTWISQSHMKQLNDFERRILCKYQIKKEQIKLMVMCDVIYVYLAIPYLNENKKYIRMEEPKSFIRLC